MRTNRTDQAQPTKKLTKKGQETRARIVAAAAKLMYERSVSRTSVEDVQREAGVNASQLYHYFAEKRELILAVIEYQTEQVLAAQEPLLSRLDNLEALRAWRDAVVKFKAEQQGRWGCPIGSLVSELADTEPAARLELAAGFMRWELSIRGGLRAMRERGELRADAEPDKLALALLVALQGGLLLAQVRRETAPLEAGLDAMLGYVATFAVGRL